MCVPPSGAINAYVSSMQVLLGNAVVDPRLGVRRRAPLYPQQRPANGWVRETLRGVALVIALAVAVYAIFLA